MEIFVENDYIGRRVDKFVRDKSSFTQAQICSFSRKKKLFVNSKNVDYQYRLQKGDVVQIAIPESIAQTIEKGDVVQIARSITHKAERIAKDLQKRIIFEDDKIICINKPHNLSVQGGKGVDVSIDDCLPYLVKSNEGGKLRIVHRIDSQTAGLLVFAKDLQTAQIITKAFANREVRKMYYAIVIGEIKESNGTIKTYIAYEDGQIKQLDRKISNSQEAITKYKVIKTIDINKIPYSLVQFMPITGRKHQIRLHVNHINCQIIGDRRYIASEYPQYKNTDLQLFATSIEIKDICKLHQLPIVDKNFSQFQQYIV